VAQYDDWDSRYVSGNIPWDTGRPSTELVSVLDEEHIAPCSAIDLGCGTGTNAVYLASLGFEVTAVDVSPTAIDRCRMRRASTDVRIRCLVADLLNPTEDIGGPYEFFFDRGCFHILRRTSVDRTLQTLEQITAPGSVGLVLTGNAKEPMHPGPPVLTEEELRTELGTLFDIVKLREIRFDAVKEGDPMPLGWSCLVRRR